MVVCGLYSLFWLSAALCKLQPSVTFTGGSVPMTAYLRSDPYRECFGKWQERQETEIAMRVSLAETSERESTFGFVAEANAEWVIPTAGFVASITKKKRVCTRSFT